MPKVKVSQSTKIKKIVHEYPAFQATPRNELYCKVCCCVVKHEKMFFVEQHLNTAKHKSGNAGESNKTQSFIPVIRKDFTEQLVKAFAASDIPLEKVQNQSLKNLFESLGQKLPSESTCRLKVHELSSKEDLQIKEKLLNKEVFFIMDGTDLNRKKFLHTLCGTLDDPSATYLIKCTILEASPTSQTILHEFDDIVKELNLKRENVDLLLSDAAAYICKAGKPLKELYPKMLHVTCIAHLLHNCSLKIKAVYPEVDKLIASLKACIVKNRTRAAQFDTLGLPPEPVVTQWGNWINAALYYSKNLPEVKEIVKSWSGDGVLVKNAKSSVNNETVAIQLLNISLHYADIPRIIGKIEASKYSIKEASTELTHLQPLSQICDGTSNNASSLQNMLNVLFI